MRFFDLLDHRVVFLAPRFVDVIVGIGAPHRSIGWNHVHVQFVNVVKLGRFRFGGAGHSRQFLIKPEIILNRDGGQCLGFTIDLDAFFRFDRLMQSIAPPPAWHLATGELIDNHHLVLFDDVLNILLEQAVSAQQL